jgi:hypothetical protein
MWSAMVRYGGSLTTRYRAKRPGAYYVLQKDGRFTLSTAPGNVAVSANVLPDVDVFPATKNLLLYGALGLAALLIITRR